jgi:hypothetical protein
MEAKKLTRKDKHYHKGKEDQASFFKKKLD